MSDGELGPLPAITVEIVAERSAESRCDEGFLRLRRLTLRNVRPDGTRSEPYAYDLVERDAMDAVAIVLAARDAKGGVLVCLRSALRPPLALRPSYSLPIPEATPAPVQWEVPAGLVEREERGADGLRGCAARETLEEVGLVVPPSHFVALGPPLALSPGVIGEKVHFLVADVDPAEVGTPTEDGSPVEADAVVRFVPLAEALAAVRAGVVADVKTEIALRRLAERP